MARAKVEKTRTKSYMKTREYIDGNTVRREQVAVPVPKQEPRKSNPNRQKSIEFQRRLAEERKKSNPYTIKQKLVVASSVSIVAIASIFYLLSESSVANNMNQLKTMQKQYNQLVIDNDALENDIVSGIDLQQIYDIATGELGMVYPGKDQVRSYEKTEGDYVRQYDKIPTE